MKTCRALSAALLLAWSPDLCAQRFTMSATTATPVTLTCSLPGEQTQTRTAPAGVAAASVGLLAFLNGPAGNAGALVDGSVDVNPEAVTMTVFENVGAWGTGSASTGPHEFLMTVQSTVPGRVIVEVDWAGQLSSGVAHVVQVDVGDDQLIDFHGVFLGQRLLVPVTLGPTPFGIRTHTLFTVPGGAMQNGQSTLRVTVRADLFGTVQPVRNLLPCGDELAVHPDLEQNLVFGRPIASGLPVPSFLVLGFTNIGWQLPGHCILWPNPDIVAAFGSAALRIDMQQPQARGVRFSAQAVSFWPLGQPVRASGAYAIELL